MVFCGKPSRGCAGCRAKKTRCDRVAPSCGQCVRAGRQCSGYRSELDMAFRDQTKEIVTRLEKTTGPCKDNMTGMKKSTKPRIAAHVCKKRSSSNGTLVSTKSTMYKYAISSESTSPLWEDDQASLLTPSLSLAAIVEQSATSTFFNRYILVDGSAVKERQARKDLYFVPIVYDQAPNSSMLSQVIVALGLEGLTRETEDIQVTVASRRKYASALRLTNKALSNPRKAVEDETLTTVMLLALYETMTCIAPESVKAWTNHLDGACKLLEMRGVDQFKIPVGRSMFERLRTQILISCFPRRTCIPPGLLALSDMCQEFQTEEERPASSLLNIAARLCALFQDIEDCHVVSIDLTNSFIQALIAIDANFLAFAEDLPTGFAKRRFHIDDSEYDIWCGQYDIYSSQNAANVWNSVRCMRILLNESIIRQITESPYAHERGSYWLDWEIILRTAEITNLELRSEVCASIPFYLHPELVCRSGAVSSTVHSRTATLWPLYLIANNARAPFKMRQWCIRQLRHVSTITGARQGIAMANVLEKGMPIVCWCNRTMDSEAQETAKIMALMSSDIVAGA